MRRPAVLLISTLLLAGCGGEQTVASSPGGSAPTTPAAATTPPAAPATSAQPAPATRGTVVKTADSQFGQMLFDGRGQAIYLFDKERTSKPECYDACAEAWPPVLTEGAPVAAAGADSKLLGTTKRTDGTTQITYAGHPLYFYAHEGVNQVLCHNVRGFGGLWLVVTPSGEPAPH
jgi:predicted lipoprotein with Yx(FWY)xxD motif